MKKVDLFLDLQTLHNLAKEVIGTRSKLFMENPQPSLDNKTPEEFLQENSSNLESYQSAFNKVKKVIEKYKEYQ